MPVINSSDTHGRFYKFGVNGKKYYYVSGNKLSRETAKSKCKAQGRAIEYSKHKRI